jgi:pimeloyl-ACP methyl ester carboxylesterase
MSKVAADAIALLDQLGIATAHVGGHSYGGRTALQLAVDAPTRVHTLPLLEACVMCVSAAADFSSGAATIVEMLESCDAEGALVALLTAVGGPAPVSRLNRTLPAGWFDQARADLSTVTFAADIPSLGAWQFGREQAAAITQPALTLVGSESAAWPSTSGSRTPSRSSSRARPTCCTGRIRRAWPPGCWPSWVATRWVESTSEQHVVRERIRVGLVIPPMHGESHFPQAIV